MCEMRIAFYRLIQNSKQGGGAGVDYPHLELSISRQSHNTND